LNGELLALVDLERLVDSLTWHFSRPRPEASRGWWVFANEWRSDVYATFLAQIGQDRAVVVGYLGATGPEIPELIKDGSLISVAKTDTP
jgi:hypothetical protein